MRGNSSVIFVWLVTNPLMELIVVKYLSSTLQLV
jgi:hypothetical protein